MISRLEPHVRCANLLSREPVGLPSCSLGEIKIYKRPNISLNHGSKNSCSHWTHCTVFFFFLAIYFFWNKPEALFATLDFRTSLIGTFSLSKWLSPTLQGLILYRFNQHASAKAPGSKPTSIVWTANSILFLLHIWFSPCIYCFRITRSSWCFGKKRGGGSQRSGVNTENYSGTLVQLRSVEFLPGRSFGGQDEGNVPAELPGQCGWTLRLVKPNTALLSASCPRVFRCCILFLFFFFLVRPQSTFCKKGKLHPFVCTADCCCFFLDSRGQFVSETYTLFSSRQTITLPADNIPVALRTRITSVMSPLQLPGSSCSL